MMTTGLVLEGIDVEECGGHCRLVLYKNGVLKILLRLLSTAVDGDSFSIVFDLKAGMETELGFIDDTPIFLNMLNENDVRPRQRTSEFKVILVLW